MRPCDPESAPRLPVDPALASDALDPNAPMFAFPEPCEPPPRARDEGDGVEPSCARSAPGTAATSVGDASEMASSSSAPMDPPRRPKSRDDRRDAGFRGGAPPAVGSGAKNIGSGFANASAAAWNERACAHASRPSATAVSARTEGDASVTPGRI